MQIKLTAYTSTVTAVMFLLSKTSYCLVIKFCKTPQFWYQFCFRQTAKWKFLDLDYLKTYSFVKQICKKIMYKIKILAFFENTVHYTRTLFFCQTSCQNHRFLALFIFFMQKPCTVKKF